MQPEALLEVCQQISDVAADSPIDVIVIPNDEVTRDEMTVAMESLSRIIEKSSGLKLAYSLEDPSIPVPDTPLPPVPHAELDREAARHIEMPTMEHLLSHIGASPSPSKYVAEFHDAFGVEDRTTPGLEGTNRELRQDLMQEEFDELMLGEDNSDLVKIFDALVDIVVIAYGTGRHYGLDMDAGFAEVHRANMSKLDDCGHCNGYGDVPASYAGGDPKPCVVCKGLGKVVLLRGDGKIMKGSKYAAPDLALIIEQTP